MLHLRKVLGIIAKIATPDDVISVLFINDQGLWHLCSYAHESYILKMSNNVFFPNLHKSMN